MSQDDGLDELSAALAAAGVRNELFHDCIHVALPRGEGILEVKSWAGGERSVQILRRNECRNLATVPGEFDCAPQEIVARLLRKLEESGIDMRTTDWEGGGRET
jgi:hypothetical protein